MDKHRAERRARDRTHTQPSPGSPVRWTAGRKMAIKTAAIPTTTSSSTSVNPAGCLGFREGRGAALEETPKTEQQHAALSSRRPALVPAPAAGRGSAAQWQACAARLPTESD